MKYALILCSFFWCSWSFAQPPELAVVGLDSSLRWVNEHIGDEGDEALLFAHTVLRRARAENKPEVAGNVSRDIAYWHYAHVESENADTILYYDHLAYELFRQAGNPLETARSAGHVATSYSEQRRYSEAETLLFEAAGILDSLENPTELANLYAELCFVYRNAKDYESAINYGERSLAIYSSLPGEDSLQAIVPLFYLAGVYIKADEPEKALAQAERSMKMVQIGGGDELVGESLRAYGFRGMALAKLGRLDEAMANYQYAWELAKKNVPEVAMADGYKEGIGTVLYLQGKYREAIPYLKDYLEHTTGRGGSDPSLPPAYNNLSDAYARTGQLAQALTYKDAAYLLETEELTKELEATRTELRVRYATAEKDELIGEQKDTINRQGRIQQLTYVIVGLLLLGALGLILGLRNNRHKNQLLEERNQQNELLLKEIHHRVKNNLEVISSLLELQSDGLEDEGAKDAMLTSQSRVSSMGILHQTLYQGSSLKSIEMRTYFEQLAQNLLATYETGDRIQIKVAAPEIDMDVDTAIPLGLIVNELLTNSIKYAYPPEGADAAAGLAGSAGAINVVMSRVGNNFKLRVSDEGVGMQSSVKGTGFGSRLVNLLTRQLNGTFRQETSDGFLTEIDFPYPA
ncbi:histidine kinase dimerization/phosphoacceptor domain -containing protein [Neolewinella agarilytica]|uniref:histidine kinase n=1 Tax=Neolewinella agarilytica TaxID=478744 RepID=A0A1H9C7J2_9BACT|nr:histidine kinase dimerization/phosphoacceptor domain -containing protein [Neolewinella agarilytica]SEP96927.1 Two-component sensor histidine kinase, contains HisKA and HATPase domains [Neolewinella agarilytica]